MESTNTLMGTSASFMVIYASALVSIAFGFYNYFKTLNIRLIPWKSTDEKAGNVEQILAVGKCIEDGAK